MPAISQRCCIECHRFDRQAERREERSLVRCLDDRNRDGVWHRLVRAGQPACRHFEPHTPTPPTTRQEEPAA